MFEELKNSELDAAYENTKMNEFFNSQPLPNYAYLQYSLGSTYAGIKNGEEYYVIMFEGRKPEEALPRIKISNLRTQYSENLTEQDQKELALCRRTVNKHIEKLNSKTRGGRNGYSQ